MKAVIALAMVLLAFLSGLAIVLSAEPIEAPVRVLLGLGFAGALTWALRGPLGQAMADQLRGPAPPGAGEKVLVQLDEVMGELQAVRDDLAQLNERIDFTERMLMQRQQARIGEGLGDEP